MDNGVVNGLAGRTAVVAKLGMDAHWRGAIVVAHALREAGMTVVYLGHATAEELVEAVRRVDPVLVGLSSLSGNHLGECERAMAALTTAGLDDRVVVVGGTVPAEDHAPLAAIGVARVFGAGSRLPDILAELAGLVAARPAEVRAPA